MFVLLTRGFFIVENEQCPEHGVESSPNEHEAGHVHSIEMQDDDNNAWQRSNQNAESNNKEWEVPEHCCPFEHETVVGCCNKEIATNMTIAFELL